MNEDPIEVAWKAFAASRDASAFERLFVAARGLVARVAWESVRDTDWTDDTVQSTFARLWLDDQRQLPPNASAREAFVRWTLNEARTINRRRWRQAGREATLEAEVLSIADESPTPGEAANERLLAERVRDMVQTLPGRYRDVLVACGMEGMNNTEAARALGLSPNTVRSQLRRGRAMLERKLRAAGITLSSGLVLATVGREAPAGPSIAMTGAGIMENAAATVEAAGPLVATISSVKTAATIGVAAAALLIVGITAAMMLPNGSHGSESVPAAEVADSTRAVQTTPSKPEPAQPDARNADATETEAVQPSQKSASDQIAAPVPPENQDVEPEQTDLGPTVPWSGMVTAERTGEPIKGAQVYVVGGSDFFMNYLNSDEPSRELKVDRLTETETDEMGNYDLDIPESAMPENGFVLIGCEADGFATQFAFGVTQVISAQESVLEFALPPAGTISGTVVNSRLEPVEGALVGFPLLSLGDFDYNSLGTGFVFMISDFSTTDEDGSFSLEKLPAGQEVVLPVISREYPTYYTPSTLVGLQGYQIVLEGGTAVVEGQVTAAGIPREGVLVSLQSKDEIKAEDFLQQLTNFRRTVTDGQGWYRIENVEAGNYRMMVNPSGFQNVYEGSMDRDLTLKEGQTFEASFDIPGTAVISGRAIESVTGEPVPGVRVGDAIGAGRLDTDEYRNDPKNAGMITGPDGTFRVERPVSSDGGRTQARIAFVVPDGYLVDDIHVMQRDDTYVKTVENVVPGGESTVTLHFRKATSVSGRVLDIDGSTPVANATVEPHWGHAETTRTDAQGRFEVFLNPDNNTVIEARTNRGVGYVEGSVDELAEDDQLTIVLRKYASVTGRVTMPNGDAPERLHVDFWRKFEDTGISFSTETPEFVITDDEGYFSAEMVPPGSFKIKLTYVGGSDEPVYEPVVLELEPGGVRQGILIELGGSDVLDGVVLDQDGDPVQGAWVYLTWKDDQGVHQHQKAKTGQDGYYAIEFLQSGEFSHLSFNHSSFYQETLGVSSGELEGWPEAPFNMTLKRKRPLAIEVIDPQTNTPVAGYRYRIRELTGHGWQPEQSGVHQTSQSLRLDQFDDGDMLIETVELDAGGNPTGRRGYERFEIDRETVGPEGTHVTVPVRHPNGTIKGTLIEHKTGEPMAGIKVDVGISRDNFFVPTGYSPDFDIEPVETGADGSFEFAGLVPGQYRVAAQINKDGRVTFSPVQWVTVEEDGTSKPVTLKVY